MNTPFLPNIGELSKYISGNLGISEVIITDATKALLVGSLLSFAEKTKFTKSLSDDNPLTKLEKTIFQTIFDMHKPIMILLENVSKLINNLDVTILSDILNIVGKVTSIFTDPVVFLTSILLEKLSKNFDFFNQNLLNKYKTLKNKKTIVEKNEYLAKNKDLQKYATIDSKGNVKFLADGVNSIEIFGLTLAIGIRDGVIVTDKLISDKENALLKFILKTIMIPFDFIKKIIEKLIDIIKGITIDNIATTVKSLLTFKFLTDILNPNAILEFLGIKLNSNAFNEVNKNKKNKKNNKGNTNPNIIDISFLGNLPNMTDFELYKMFQENGDMFMGAALGFFLLFDGIINKLINFIFSLFCLPNSFRFEISIKNNIQKQITDALGIENISSSLFQARFSDGRIIKNLSQIQVDELKIIYNNAIFTFL